MKKASLITLLLILGYGLSTAQGIEFDHSTFDEVLAKAKKENKAVFMDCYTSWCGPCKALTKTVFPQKMVGNYFNRNFVNFKIDMEKGEGPQLAQKYKVQAYPTMLFLNADGEVLHIKVGFANAEGLIAEAETAMNSEMSFGAMKKKYIAGERNHAFLIKYLSAMDDNGLYDEMEAVGKDFHKNTLPADYFNKEVIEILRYINLEYGSKSYYYFLENKAKFLAISGTTEEGYDRILSNTYFNYLYPFSEGKSLTKLLAEIAKCKQEYTCIEQLELEFDLISEYYYLNKEYNNWYNYFVKTAERYKSKDPKLGHEAYLNLLYDIALEQEKFKSAKLTDKGIAIGLQLIKEAPEMVDVYSCMAEFYLFNKNKAEAMKWYNNYIAKKEAKGEQEDSYDKDLKGEIEKL